MWYLVDSDALGDALAKTARCKELLSTMQLGDALAECNLGRSTYFKYKSKIVPYIEESVKQYNITIITLHCNYYDTMQKISEILQKYKCEVDEINYTKGSDSSAIKIKIKTESKIAHIIRDMEQIKKVKGVSV